MEFDRLAIQAARENAAARGRTNGEFMAGTAEELLPACWRASPRTTTVLLDPPRKGCLPRCSNFFAAQPAQIIYVSCHPATMARDLNLLCAECIFLVARVMPLDMFPQTAHVECVADLRSSPPLPETT